MDDQFMMIIKSPHQINETLGRLLKLLAEHDMTIFSIIDHSGGAEQVGLKMPETKLVIFGNPKSGTDLMLADHDFSIDLPLKIVLRKNKDDTEILYQTVTELAMRYNVSRLNDSIRNIDKTIENMLEQIILK
jgi:uncharacterized protein (DUF302 family)